MKVSYKYIFCPVISKKFCVYGLLCPVELEIKYIGSTQNLKNRLYSHLSKTSYSPEKDRWIKDLRQKSLFPIPVVFKEFSTKKVARAYESVLIKQHSDKLINQELKPKRKYTLNIDKDAKMYYCNLSINQKINFKYACNYYHKDEGGIYGLLYLWEAKMKNSIKHFIKDFEN